MKAITIVLYNNHAAPLSPVSEFVEIENDKGKSISIGSVSTVNEEGYYRIRITEDDIKELQI